VWESFEVAPTGSDPRNVLAWKINVLAGKGRRLCAAAPPKDGEANIDVLTTTTAAGHFHSRLYAGGLDLDFTAGSWAGVS